MARRGRAHRPAARFDARRAAAGAALRGRCRDDGLATTALLLVVGLGMLVLLAFRGVMPLGLAGDEAQRAQTAADAAALAGAERVVEDFLLLATSGDLTPDDLTGFGTAGSGSAQADAYASANGARITSYAYAAGAGQVAVEVEKLQTRVPDALHPAQAASRAATGLALSACQLGDLPEVPPAADPADPAEGGEPAAPAPDPGGAPEAPVEPAAPATAEVELECPDLLLTFRAVANADGVRLQLLDDPDDVRDSLRPRLLPSS